MKTQKNIKFVDKFNFFIISILFIINKLITKLFYKLKNISYFLVFISYMITIAKNF